MSRSAAMAIVFLAPTLLLSQTPSRIGRTHVTLNEQSWTSSQQYPEPLRQVYRYKALIGSQRPGVVPQGDILMGVLELAPRATYPAHKHPAPELYYVMSGTAQWTVGSETFAAGPGTAIYHPPDTLHRMINTGDEVLKTVYMWWAPGGDTTAIRASSQLLEPVPQQPPQAKFKDQMRTARREVVLLDIGALALIIWSTLWVFQRHRRSPVS